MAEVELVRLPNGVRVALDPMSGIGTAALGVWQRVGARWETPAENGVAHLFEHMAFKGAGGRDARQFAEAIEAVGGVMNAATGYERTTYYARTLAEHAPFALELIADILFAPHWDGGDLEKEKGVVAQERGEAFDVPDDRVFELHQAALYPDQPLGRPILGDAATLREVKVATLERFRDAHLSPERVVISIAGGFDRAALLATVEARFGGLAPRPEQKSEPARPCAGRSGEIRKLEQAHLVLSWPGPSAGSDEQYAARLLSEVFGGGMSSRLFQEIREARGLVYAIDSFHEALEDDGRLMVYAGCAAANAATVAKIVQEQLALLAEHGPSPAELDRAKAISRAQMMMGAEAPAARAEARASQIFLRDKVVAFESLRDRIAGVSAEEVQAAAAKALSGPRCASVIGPKQGHGALGAFVADS